MTTPRGIILPPYKAQFAARLPVGGVMQMRVPCNPQPVIDTAYPKPPHKPGDVVFGKERFIRGYHLDGGELIDCDEDGNPIPMTTWYAADEMGSIKRWEDDGKLLDHVPWLPANRMTAEHARLFFRVRSVRVERLQKIGHTDIWAEGIGKYTDPEYGRTPYYYGCDKTEFEHVWDAHHKRHPWKSNPFCWVYELERTERP